MKKYLNQFSAISWVTFHELIREKVLWSAFVFAVLCIGLSYSISRLSFVENARIAMDFGLAAVSVVGGLISIMMGSSLISKEIENRTAYLTLTKATPRWVFIIGRVGGLLLVVFLNSILMGFTVIAIYLISGGKLTTVLMKGFLLQLIEFGMLASIASIFSSFSTAALSAVVTSGVWITGHAMTDLHILAEKIEPPLLRPFLYLVGEVFPDLTRFDVKPQISHDLPVSWVYTFSTAGYGLAYMIFALVVSCMVFSKRDL